jgi:D-alanyl-D-alanine endopeptidase (penicillin-binding protein 7)
VAEAVKRHGIPGVFYAGLWLSFQLVFGAAVLHAEPAGQSTTTKTTATKTSAKKYSAASARARRAKLARARAAAAARDAREAAQPRFKLDPTGSLVPAIRAEAGIIYNPTTGEVLWEEHSLDQRSLASITKTMTALVFIQENPDVDREVDIVRSDVYRASTTYLRSRDRVRVGDLLHLLLIASDNAAARALARISTGGSTVFVERMNAEARRLGLVSTEFVDPSGLYSGNLSSAYDISRLIFRAASDERLGPIMRKTEHTVYMKRRTVTIRNTNKLLDGSLDVLAGKTGFISKAGYCLATLMQLPQGDQVAVVILGAKSSAARFWEARHLFNWLNGKAQDWFGTAQAEPQD